MRIEGAEFRTADGGLRTRWRSCVSCCRASMLQCRKAPCETISRPLIRFQQGGIVSGVKSWQSPLAPFARIERDSMFWLIIGGGTLVMLLTLIAGAILIANDGGPKKPGHGGD